MPKFHKEVTIQAPVENVFQYLDSPTNLPEVWPSFYEVKDNAWRFGWCAPQNGANLTR